MAEETHENKIHKTREGVLSSTTLNPTERAALEVALKNHPEIILDMEEPKVGKDGLTYTTVWLYRKPGEPDTLAALWPDYLAEMEKAKKQLQPFCSPRVGGAGQQGVDPVS